MSDEHQPGLNAQLDRIERKLDSYMERLATVETDHRWLKSGAKWSAALLMAIVGKLAHLTFFKPN